MPGIDVKMMSYGERVPVQDRWLNHCNSDGSLIGVILGITVRKVLRTISPPHPQPRVGNQIFKRRSGNKIQCQCQLLFGNITGSWVHTNKILWYYGKQTCQQSWTVHQNQFKSLVNICPEANVGSGRSKEEKEGGGEERENRRRHSRLAKRKTEIFHIEK